MPAVPSYWVEVLPIIVVVVVVVALLRQCIRFVVPGWRYELLRGGRTIKVLDTPGMYLVSPFVTARRVRIDSTPVPSDQSLPRRDS
jgi:regulator of protease activity HflC (stomatin/prohibitin superfamily)